MLDTMFATETMAELSARQGRLADAMSIYRHLIAGAEAAGGPGGTDTGRVEKWRARLAELGTGAASAPPSPPVDRPPESAPAPSRVPEAPRTPPVGSSLVVREPVRSGQVIYAEGRDLIVVASVNSGAQVLADGNIHVYGALKGRAVAGAHGQRDAQVFCLALEAELVGVDTGYLLSDDLAAHWSAPARVALGSDGTCIVTPLPLGKAAAVAGRSSRPLRG